jgi:histidinol-phosphate aminotransferase
MQVNGRNLMKNWIKKIQRSKPDFIDRSKYLRLDKNERVIPFEKKFIKFLKKKINTFNLSAYPAIQKIKKLIAKKIKVNEDMIFISAGSDISLKTCFELFTKKNDKVIILEPTFGMVNVYSDLYGLKVIKIGYDKNLILDYKKLFKNISNQISLIILANPNSPTGTIIPKKTMLKIFNQTKKKNIPIVIDEAYEGFYPNSYIKYVKKYKNLIITRTFSKSFGLAGLRAGYAVSNYNYASLLNKYRPMYEINSLSCLAIEFCLKNYSIVKQHIKQVKLAKKFLIKELRNLNIEFIDTYANFFHIKLGNKNKILEKKFKNKGILFRKGPGVKGLESFARFSLGSKKQMFKLLNIIKNDVVRKN